MDRIEISRIFDSPFQARAIYNNIAELAASILRQADAWPETSGLIQVPPARIVIGNIRDGQPFKLEPWQSFKVLDPDEYGGVEFCLSDEPDAFVQLGAGHRRHRAFAYLFDQGHEAYATMPLEIKVLSDEAMIDIMRDENEERDDLTAIEQAMQLQLTMASLKLTQEQVGERWGLSKSAVSNKLRLLKLPQDAQQAILDGKLNERHGRVLLAAQGKSGRIYQRLAGRLMPPDEEAEKMASELLAKHEFGRRYFYEAGKGNICAACQQEIIAADNDCYGYGETYICERCYRAASGSPPPSTQEAEGMLSSAINHGLKANPDQEAEAEAKKAAQTKKELRAIRQQALDFLSQLFADDPGHPGIWLGLARQGDNSLAMGEKSLFELKRMVLDELLEDMGLYRRPSGYWEMWGADKYRDEVEKRLGKIGISLPAKVDQLRQRLERVGEFVQGNGQLTDGQLAGNLANIDKIMTEAEGLFEAEQLSVEQMDGLYDQAEKVRKQLENVFLGKP